MRLQRLCEVFKIIIDSSGINFHYSGFCINIYFSFRKTTLRFLSGCYTFIGFIRCLELSLLKRICLHICLFIITNFWNLLENGRKIWIWNKNWVKFELKVSKWVQWHFTYCLKTLRCRKQITIDLFSLVLSLSGPVACVSHANRQFFVGKKSHLQTHIVNNWWNESQL